jgi:hypothetical protein
LLLTAAAVPGDSEAALADWPLGRREAALLRLRRKTFGASMPICVACPGCSQELEIEIDAGGVATEGAANEILLDTARAFAHRRPRI